MAKKKILVDASTDSIAKPATRRKRVMKGADATETTTNTAGASSPKIQSWADIREKKPRGRPLGENTGLELVKNQCVVCTRNTNGICYEMPESWRVSNLEIARQCPKFVHLNSQEEN